MGESWLPVNTMMTAHLALPAAIHRIKMLEERMAGQDAQITQLAGMIAKAKEDGGQIDKLASMMGEIARTIPLKPITHQIEGVDSLLQIPRELLPRVTKSKTGSNRTYEVVKKRWALWKTQLAAGANINEMARAWNCHRSSIKYASRYDFVASNGNPINRKISLMRKRKKGRFV